MNRAVIVAVLWLFVMPLLCSSTLYAQHTNINHEKPKKQEVVTDLGNPAKAAAPSAADKARAEQLKKKSPLSQIQQPQTNAQPAQPAGTKAPEKQTVRGSKENASKLTPGEIEKLRNAHLTPAEKNK